MKYWNHTNFAKWLTKTLGGLEQPRALTGSGWRKWRADAKQHNPFAYWLVHKFLVKLQRVVTSPWKMVKDAKHYVRTRYITQPHVVTTTLERGQYHEIDTRMMYSMFQLLVDYVDVELASMYVWNKDKKRKYNFPWWHDWFLFRWSTWRCAEAGLEYLKWEIDQKTEAHWYADKNDPNIGQPTDQAVSAAEIMRLYDWWVNVRPNRPEAFNESGLAAIYEAKRGLSVEEILDIDSDSVATKETMAVAQDKMDQIQTSYEQQDEQMMIDLIKVRHKMWT